jgi:fermentation-respiration switch protein FrsA (DUF1100 family)
MTKDSAETPRPAQRRDPNRARTVRRWVLGAVLGYALIVGLMASLETALVFPVPRIDRDHLSRAAAAFGAQEVVLSAEDGMSLYGWRTGNHDRLVLYFSGNGSSVGEGDLYRSLDRAGMSTLHINYRGYPGSEGSPSEAGITLDARAAWQEARRTHPADRIIVMGKSLGGGVAAGLVAGLADEQPALLILESTFTSAADVGAESYPWLPVRRIMRNRFDSMAIAHQIRCPTWVLHGTADRMIRTHHGRALAGAIEGAIFIGAPQLGHNDRILTYAPVWKRFLDAVGGPPGRDE